MGAGVRSGARPCTLLPLTASVWLSLTGQANTAVCWYPAVAQWSTERRLEQKVDAKTSGELWGSPGNSKTRNFRHFCRGGRGKRAQWRGGHVQQVHNLEVGHCKGGLWAFRTPPSVLSKTTVANGNRPTHLDALPGGNNDES